MTILATGGTIATAAYEDGTTRAVLSGKDLASTIGPLADSPIIRVEQISQRPSWSMTPGDMLKVALRARDLASRSHGGVVVTHGTTTMEYTAFLTDLLLTGSRPAVFTGAMRRADLPDPDGPRNLRDAVLISISPEATEMGTLVCFGGDIFAARDVEKQHRSSITPFGAPQGRLGHVDGNRVVFERRPFRPRTFDGTMQSAVSLVKAFPGCTGILIDAAIGEGAKGIVLEGLPGSGGLPPEMHAAVGRALGSGVVMVLASSSRVGRMMSSDGGTGEPLRELNLISAGNLTAEKAWILLMLALGEASEMEEVRAIFAQFSSTRPEISNQKEGVANG